MEQTPPIVTPVAPPIAPAAEQPHFVRQEIAYEVDPGAARKRAALWCFVGGGAFLLASNQVTWYEKSQYEHALGSATAYTTTQTDQANHARDVARYVGTPLFLVGAAGVGAAVYLYLTAESSERVHKTVWVPAVDSGNVGVAVSGRF